MSKRVLILGSTGSIGTQTLDIIRENPSCFSVCGMAVAGHKSDLFLHHVAEYGVPVDHLAIADPSVAAHVEHMLGVRAGTILTGEHAARDLVELCAQEHCVDVVLNALVGALGLGATLATLDAGLPLALANKESLVAGGEVVMARAQPGQIIPVDSEHSAIAQCMRAGKTEEISRIVLTASGGPFRGWTRDALRDVTPAQAAAHPTWSMGQMNTLNSATLVNKGLELIEASMLFSLPPHRIDVVVHPQSIVHSMVTFVDGATIAQASPPSMKLPISHALAWPERVPEAQPALTWSDAQAWTFEPIDGEVFPAVELARDVAERGGVWPAMYNAANEEAAEAFLAGRIRFTDIVDTVDAVLTAADRVVGATATAAHTQRVLDVDDILEAQRWARIKAKELVHL